MNTCDRCGDDADALYCTGCGGVAHGPCQDDSLGLGCVCGPCWAILAHVERVLACASGCDCLSLYADEIARAREDE